MSISIPVATEQSFTYSPSLNAQGPQLTRSGEILKVSRAADVSATNQWNRIELASVTWGTTKYLALELKANSITASTEVKMDYPGGVILRYSQDKFSWVYWDGSFRSIGPSNIAFGDNKYHQVQFLYKGDSVEIFEDGASKGSRSTDPSKMWDLNLGFQILAANTGVDIEIKDIKVLDK